MKEMLLSLILVVVSTSYLPAETAARQRYEALIKEYESAQAQFQKDYQKAKTDAQREKVVYPSSDKYADRFLAIAKEQPADPAALDALVWVATNCRNERQAASLELLLKDHLQSTNLAQVADALI